MVLRAVENIDTSLAVTPPTTAVIGCGNAARTDDGAGVQVVRRLCACAELAAPGVSFIDAGTSGIDVMFSVRGVERVFIVDACRSGSEPGTVFRIPASELQTRPELAFTLHGLRWDHALYAGSRMFGPDFARNAEVFLVEAGSLDWGIGLTDPVERGVELIVAEIRRILQPNAAIA